MLATQLCKRVGDALIYYRSAASCDPSPLVFPIRTFNSIYSRLDMVCPGAPAASCPSFTCASLTPLCPSKPSMALHQMSTASPTLRPRPKQATLATPSTSRLGSMRGTSIPPSCGSFTSLGPSWSVPGTRSNTKPRSIPYSCHGRKRRESSSSSYCFVESSIPGDDKPCWLDTTRHDGAES